MNALAVFIGLVAGVGAVALAQDLEPQGSDPQDWRRPPNFQSNPEFERIDRERGAVLCSWMIVTELKAIHQQCHAGNSPEIAAALDRSLDRFHTFIVANSDETLEALETSVARRLVEARSEPGICANESLAFYGASVRSAAEIDAWTERVLAIPRPPVLNPCL